MSLFRGLKIAFQPNNVVSQGRKYAVKIAQKIVNATGRSVTVRNADRTAGAFGALIGAFLAGWLGDLCGRKFSFQFNLLLFGGASLAAVFVPSMDWLIPLRFITGIGLGAEIVVAYVTITEFVPPAKRGKWSAVLFFAGTAALPTSNILGYLLIPAVGWRSMFAIAGLGAMFVWWMRKQLPESPRWLESKGHLREAREILDRIEADVVKDTGAALLVPDVAASVSSTEKFTFGDLFKPNLLRSTITGMVPHIVALSSLYGFIVWLLRRSWRRRWSRYCSLRTASLR